VHASEANVTLCITMGRRPALLRETLRSLASVTAELPILAVNDFGDELTNAVLHELCPHARLLNLPGHLGHHRVVDRMYSEVQTEFILHCEDDWLFSTSELLSRSLPLLTSSPRASQVCFRDIRDIAGFGDRIPKLATKIDQGALALTEVHDQWFGFTFNPHLIRRSLWESLGGYAAFKKERHISRALRAQGLHTAYLATGGCTHLGGEESVSTPPPSRFRGFLRSFTGL
jgi:hypothetical protein